MFFALNSPASSAFAPSSAEATASDGPGKPPEVRRRSTRRRPMARSRLQSSCCPKAPRWTPRKTMARSPKAGSRARIPSPTRSLGLKFMRKKMHFQQMLDKVVTRKMFGYVWINDHMQRITFPFLPDGPPSNAKH